MKKMKKGALKVLVFYAAVNLLFLFLRHVVFGLIDVPDPYDLIVQLASAGIAVLLALLITGYLTNGDA
ncbi:MULTISPECIES: hypothetical protein [Paenibacillus]|uniref:hypothetical protein n=1 Tax=Paenibacillus TaxID=44249 RepID=UPI002FE006D7